MKYVISLFVFFHFSLHASTFVLFSNNSHSSYKITSQLVDKSTNLKPEYDYETVNQVISSPFLPNLKTLRFNSNVHIQNGQKYEFEVSIEESNFPFTRIKFYITTQGQFTGSKIINTKIKFPDGRFIDFSPKYDIKLAIPEWSDKTLYFIPFSRTDSGVSWPSFVLSVDEPPIDRFDFSSANTFKAVNYNIQVFPFYGDIISPPNNKAERMKRIPVLLGNNYDFISLNEVFDRDLRNQMIRDMEINYPYHAGPPGMEGSNFLSSGVLVFSKWPILETKQYVYKNCEGEECAANKGIAYVKIQKNVNGISENYNIFSTHVQAYQNTKDTQAYYHTRSKQVRELREFIAAQNIPNHEPVLVTGDLNIDKYNNESGDYFATDTQSEYEYLLSELNAVDPKAAGLKYSYDARLNTMITTDERSRLDYVLYLNHHKNPLNAVNYVRTMRDVSNPKMYPNYDTSDHFPVIGAFIF